MENYHGKALGEQGKAAVEKLKEGLVNDKHNLGPQPVVDDAPPVDLSPGTIKLSEPPSYKVGDKVITPFISKAPSWISQRKLAKILSETSCFILWCFSKLSY